MHTRFFGDNAWEEAGFPEDMTRSQEETASTNEAQA